MKRLPLLALLLALVLAGATSCAVTDAGDQAGPSAYAPPPQDPARIGLPPPYRVFYDELRDEGDWTLIEPYGWCFRPRVNFVAWRPYLDGWWEPSDFYGWIWNSNEPFGWVTYHYGAWFYDDYQGWVWQPGPVWGPAWVAWISLGDFVGWAPLAPSQYDGFSNVPGGIFTYAPTSQFSSREVGQDALFMTQVPTRDAAPREIANIGRVNGVSFNKGPNFTDLQVRGVALPPRTDPGDFRKVKFTTAPTHPGESDLSWRTNRVTSEGLREWSAWRERGATPPASPMTPGEIVRQKGTMPPRPEPGRVHAPAPRDTTRHAARPKPPEREPSPRDSLAERGREMRPAAPARGDRAPRPAERDSSSRR